MRIVDLTGQKFGKLTVIRLLGTDGHNRFWECKCECGNMHIARTHHLKSGNVKSCGCLQKECDRHWTLGKDNASYKHGDYKTKLYNVWNSMKSRCQNPNTMFYKDYGGRGITVCGEWQEYINFKEWAINAGYEEGLTIDRIDNDGNYCPENCRWISHSEQCKNRRSNIHIEYEGKTYTVQEIADLTGLKVRTIRGRLERGVPVEKLFSKELGHSRWGA